jgi:hypothetical protein
MRKLNARVIRVKVLPIPADSLKKRRSVMQEYLESRLAVWRQIKTPVGVTVKTELEIILLRLSVHKKD